MPRSQRQQVCSRGQRSSHLLSLIFLFLSLAAQPGRAAMQIPVIFKVPPVITKHPESVTVFGIEEFVMSCEASGNPNPNYRWTKDGKEIDPFSDPGLKPVNESTFYTHLHSIDALKKYAGKYVCYASNELGTAVSNEAILRTDVLPTQQKETIQNLKAEEGHSFVLRCDPPKSSIKPTIHWMDLELRHIQLSERVMAGKDGNLYFANVIPTDTRKDYTCTVQYLLTRTILTKEPISLTVNPSNSLPRNRRPQMMRPHGSQSTYRFLRGQTVELECIVLGLPTPKVQWLRKDGEMSESRTVKDMFSRRLRFNNISESDGGEYQCIAENTQGKVTHTYMLTVEAAPYWIKKPVSQFYAPGETVRQDCLANGTPKPTIWWTINGIPLSETDKDSRRTVTASGSLILKDVDFGDTAIYQCWASNGNGTILTNVNVYVIELPPVILTDDAATYSYTEGQKALLECDTFGSPRPKVLWERGTSLLADPRVNPLANGGLEISNVTHDDKGLYICNVGTNLSISAELEIFNRTVIISPPQPQKLQPGSTAIFSCVALVDASLTPPQIQWRKNSQKLFESPMDEKYTFEGPNLIVANVEPEDEGEYTCQAITTLDMAEASSDLTLCDRPDPPGVPQISDPQPRAVTVSWTPGDDHKSPVQKFVIEFEDQNAKDRGWEELITVGGNKERAFVQLWPYMSYRFRVIAINEMGRSDSSSSSEVHNTPPAAPDKNPEDVTSESVDPGTLVISWKEMDKHNFNGPDFKYRVQWRKAVGSGPKWHMRDAASSPFLINDVGNFSAFEIKVQAVNEISDGPDPSTVIGYSGEDVPLEAPMDVGIEELNSTTIKVVWAPIDKETVRGHLLGYKIHLTRTGYRDNHRGRRSREPENIMVVEAGPNEMKRIIGDLRPYSHYVLAMAVFNLKGDGPLSQELSFTTEEGVPGPPASLRLDSQSETEMTLWWSPPSQPNGVLTRFLLQYQRITERDDSPMQIVTIDNPTVTHFSLDGLDRHSHYRFYLRACTDTGDGEPIIMTGATTLEGAPPGNISLSVGENSVNVSWIAKKRHRNVDFQIHYLNQNGLSKWKKSEKLNSAQSFYQLKGLSPGSHYHLNFIYSNNTFWETEIDTEGTEVMERQQPFGTQGWFIGLVSAIGLLLLILLILCFIKRSKGGKYSVKDKEDGPMDSEARPMKDETFGEYRSLESDLEEKQTASLPSLCEASKLCSQDNLDFNGSSAMTTELNLDGSLVSEGQEGFHGLQDNSPLNLTTFSSATNGMPNAVTFLD